MTKPIATQVSDLMRSVDAYAFDYANQGKLAPSRRVLDQELTSALTGAQCQEGQVFGIIDPDYGRVFTSARLFAWNYGYSLCPQGSFTRDLDLLMVPWTEQARPEVLHILDQLAEDCDLRLLDRQPTEKPHGRLTWTLVFKKFASPRFVDFSVFPAKAKNG